MELEKLLKKISLEFEKNKIDYMVIGGQAVLIYGEPRLTKDIDIILGTDIDRFKDTLEIVKKMKLKILPKNPYDFVKETMVFPLLDEKTGIRIDLIFSFSEYEKEALKRINRVKISDFYVNYVSLEDLIIQKIISGRERDIEDIRIVMLKNKKIDEKYILKWLLEFEKTLNVNFKKIFERLKKEKNKDNFENRG
jgi:predicted nucleotidyltransferase